MPEASVSEIILLSILSGIAGTIAMTIFLIIVFKSGAAEADMIRALGSLITKSEKNSFKTGILIHSISGIVFGFVYTIIITTLKVQTWNDSTAAGIIIGIIHGIVVAFFLVALIAEKHPLPRFQQAGTTVAIVHWAAHVFFGITAGSVIAFIGY